MSLLEAQNVCVTYRPGGRLLHAVRGVSLSLARGERLGILGQSGSGKSSLGRALLGLEPLASGIVTFDGHDVSQSSAALRRRFQPVFQDSNTSLDPRMKIGAILAEPFEIHRLPVDETRLIALLQQVQLGAELLSRWPRELSAGQRQRVNLARALALEPELLVLDEPVSALDVSVQAQLLNLLMTLVQERSLSLVVITHELDVAAYVCTSIAVMHDGCFVEEGSVSQVLNQPLHPYTRLLVESRRSEAC